MPSLPLVGSPARSPARQPRREKRRADLDQGGFAETSHPTTHANPSYVEHGVVHCPEGRKLFPQMSVLKNLMLGAYVHRGDRAGNQKMLDEVFQLFPILAERRQRLEAAVL